MTDEEYPQLPPEEWEAKCEAGRVQIENAISGVVNDLRGGLVTKWFAVYEFVDESGDRDLATMSTDGLMRWDVQGMLDYVMDGNKAARFAAYLEGDKGAE